MGFADWEDSEGFESDSLPEDIESEGNHIELISDNLLANVRKSVEWHNHFVDNWFNWVDQMQASWQPVPPQAHANLHHEMRRMLDLLTDFRPSAAALKALGHPQLDQLLRVTQKHVEDADKAINSMSNSMTRGAASTAKNIARSTKKTNDYVSGVFKDLHEQRVFSADRAHKDFMRNLLR